MKSELKVVVLFSGGLDSRLTVKVLQENGYDVQAMYFLMPFGSRYNHLEEIKQFAEEQKIKLIIMDCTKGKLLQEFLGILKKPKYKRGTALNPCVDCNINIKFGLLWELARKQLGTEKIATGHYARILRDGQEYRLARAVDRSKDQSYFLSGIKVGKLAKIIFPLGELTKGEVRKMAREIGLHVADKTESMELCFAGEGDYRAMLGVSEAATEGDLLNMKGEKIGTHKGIANYTIGQRRGLGFAGGEPLYVGAIDPVKNTVALGTREETCKSIVEAGEVNVLIEDEFVASATNVIGKVRSYGEGRACEIIEAAPDRLSVRFEQEEFAPCPGQRLVIYNNRDCIIAGGTIGEDKRT